MAIFDGRCSYLRRVLAGLMVLVPAGGDCIASDNKSGTGVDGRGRRLRASYKFFLLRVR